MYPAYEYDAVSNSGLIKLEDLPDIIFRGDAQFNKINPVELSETRYGVYLDPTSPNEENEGYIYWNTEGGSFGPNWSTFEEGGRDCLINELEGFQRDDFEDTYTVVPPLGSGTLTNTVTRVSLCVWEADNEGSTEPLYREPLIYIPPNDPSGLEHGWHLSDNTGFIRKTGFQNSPVGSYGGYSVY